MYDLLALQERTSDSGRTYHEAQLQVGGQTYPVDTLHGSWRVHVEGTIRELLPPVAADLQAEVEGAQTVRRR